MIQSKPTASNPTRRDSDNHISLPANHPGTRATNLRDPHRSQPALGSHTLLRNTAPAYRATPQHSAARPAEHTAPLHLLIVDDDPPLRSACEEIGSRQLSSKALKAAASPSALAKASHRSAACNLASASASGGARAST